MIRDQYDIIIQKLDIYMADQWQPHGMPPSSILPSVFSIFLHIKVNVLSVLPLDIYKYINIYICILILL